MKKDVLKLIRNAYYDRHVHVLHRDTDRYSNQNSNFKNCVTVLRLLLNMYMYLTVFLAKIFIYIHPLATFPLKSWHPKHLSISLCLFSFTYVLDTVQFLHLSISLCIFSFTYVLGTVQFLHNLHGKWILLFQAVVSLLHSVASNVNLLMCRPSCDQLSPLPRSVSTGVPKIIIRCENWLEKE